MKRTAVMLALVAAAVLMAQPGWAREAHHARHASRGQCSKSGTEAEQAIRYITHLMVASSACHNSVYAEFALRNRTAIIHYQRTMIVRLHGKSAFDRWNTSLANYEALQQGSVPLAQFCHQAQPLMQQASALDAHGFEAFEAKQAASADPPGARCRR